MIGVGKARAAVRFVYEDCYISMNPFRIAFCQAEERKTYTMPPIAETRKTKAYDTDVVASENLVSTFRNGSVWKSLDDRWNAFRGF